MWKVQAYYLVKVKEKEGVINSKAILCTTSEHGGVLPRPIEALGYSLSLHIAKLSIFPPAGII